MVKKLWSREEDGQLPNWLNDEQKSRCYCDDRGWVLVHKDGNEEVIVAANTLNDPSERGHGFEDGKSKDADRSGAHNDVSYSLSRSSQIINEGAFATVTLTTTGVADNTQVPYTIEGVEAEDLQGGQLSGNFLVSGGTATLNLTAVNDSLTEGPQTITVRLGTGEFITVDINDTSKAPSYILSAPGSVNEGEPFTITLTTENFNDGPVAYTITGIDDNDLDIAGGSAGRTGNINVSTNTGSITLKLKEDLSFNEGDETLTLTLDGDLDTIDVTVVDSSTASPTYTLSAPETINEGQDLTITLTTEDVNDGPVPYTITGIQNADLDIDGGSAGLSGEFTVSGSPSSDSITLKLKEDLSDNENNENLVLTLNNGEDSVSVTIVDTSKAPVFNLTSNPLVSVNEGASLTINLSTENFSGNTVPYFVSGIDDNDLASGSASLNSNFSLDGNGDGSLIFNIKEDATTEGVDNFVLELLGHGQQIQVDINDTSLTPVYTLSTSPQFSVDEGLDLVVTLQTQNVPDGDYTYNISGTGFDSDDLKPTSAGRTGNFTVSGSPSTDSITLQLKNDYTSNEGDETITIALNNGGDSIQVDVIDTSNMGSTDRGQLPVVNDNLKHSSVSDDAQYAALGATSSDGSVEIFKYNGTGWDLLQTLPKPMADAFDAHGMATAFNSDGTVLAVGDGWANTYRGRVFIYRRDVNSGLFGPDPEHIIDGPHNATAYFGHGVALTGDGNQLFVVCTQTNKIYRYDYNNSEWSSSPDYTLNTPVKYRDVDVSSDGLMLVAAGGHGAPFEARVWTWDGSSFTDHSVVSMPTQNATLGVAISNKKLLAVGQVGTVNQENRVTLFDLDGTTWTPRPLESWQTSAIVGSWTINKGFKIALSEPKSDGKVLVVDHEGQMRDILATTDTYSISGPSSINEGQDLTLTLTALGIDGQVGYSISGITDADLDIAGGSDSVDGNFQVSDSAGSITLKIKEDANSSDGSLVLTLDNGEASKTVSIIDITPSYELTSSPQISVNEGSTLRISLSTENVSETSIPYTVSGIQPADFNDGSADMNGNFSLDANGDGFVDFLIKEDLTTESVAEDLVLTLTGLGEQISVNIIDSSKTPIWNLTTDPVDSVDEGNNLLVTLATQNVPAGNYAYRIEGIDAADLDIAGGSAELTGDFVITGATNDASSDSITLKLKADATSEGAETLTISLDNGEVAPITITVNDTSNSDPVAGPLIPWAGSRYPSISDDGMYSATVGGNHAANVVKFYKYENSSWTHTQSISNYDPGSQNIDGYGDIKMSSDGSIVAYCDPYANEKDSIVRVFERGGDGQYTLRDTFTPGGGGFQATWGMALSEDGQTIVVGSMLDSKIRTFEYSNGTWNPVSTISIPVKPMQLDLSSDGQKLLFGTGWNNTANSGFYIYNRDGNSWTQDTFKYIDNPNPGNVRVWSSAWSKGTNFIAVGTSGYGAYPSTIFFFDYDSSSGSWIQRSSTIVDPASEFQGHYNYGSRIALSEENNGQITLITTDGNTFTLPADPPE
ncbi:MAG: hypothetical protein CMP21_03990 [Rickettsiales bacterium]|nr:hypothetical protein [Rickettsiales bacterium]